MVLPPDLEEAWHHWWNQATPRERDDVPIDDKLELKRPGHYQAIPLERRLTGDMSPAWLGEPRNGVILGTDICADRNDDGDYGRYYLRGEPVKLTFMPFSPEGKPETGSGMPSKDFRYVDDCRTGVYEIDVMSVYIDFDLLQHIVAMDEYKYEVEDDQGQSRSVKHPARTTQIQIKLTPGVDPIETRDLIQAKWEALVAEKAGQLDDNPARLYGVQVVTWEKKQERFIKAVEKEKYLVTTLFGVISVVAVFLVGCIFYMIVQQKTRDIGIVKSVGATSWGVALIFLSYGAAVGVVGGALGALFGTLFVRNINEVQALLAVAGEKMGLGRSLVVWDPSVYTFDQIPSQVKLSDVLVIYAVAIIASMLGSVIAAIRAARVWPVEALRYE